MLHLTLHFSFLYFSIKSDNISLTLVSAKMNFKLILKVLLLLAINKVLSEPNATAKKLETACVGDKCTILNLVASPEDKITLPEDKNYPKIKALEFKDSKFSQLPLAIGKLFPNIENLDVSGVGLKKLSKSDMENFSYLKVFTAKDNKIESIAKDIFAKNPEIRELDLSNNQINCIKTKSVRDLNKLKTLNLKGNKCISEKFVDLDGDENSRQTKINKIMIKCKEEKEVSTKSSIIMSIKKSVAGLPGVNGIF